MGVRSVSVEPPPFAVTVWARPSLLFQVTVPLRAITTAAGEKVRPEATLRDVFCQVTLRGGQDSHVELQRFWLAQRLHFVCLVAAPEGLEALRAAHPDVSITTATIDRELDGNGYIRPGLGDAGDRIFGTDR